MRFQTGTSVRESWVSAASAGFIAYIRLTKKIDSALVTAEVKRLQALITRFADNKEIEESDLTEILIIVLFADDHYQQIKDEALELLI